MVTYWLRLLDTENCILKHVYNDMYESSCVKPNDKLNQSCKVRDILCKYGFSDVWFSQRVRNSQLFLSEFKQRVIDNYISEGLSYFENSPKCTLYQYLHDGHIMQFYLSRPLNSLYRSYITRHRINAHALCIETGRYYSIARNERLCSMCNKNAIEDEYHFILECDKYNDIRCKYIKSYYYERPSTFKLVQLLSVRNVKELNNLGKYLFLAEKARNGQLFKCLFLV